MGQPKIHGFIIFSWDFGFWMKIGIWGSIFPFQTRPTIIILLVIPWFSLYIPQNSNLYCSWLTFHFCRSNPLLPHLEVQNQWTKRVYNRDYTNFFTCGPHTHVGLSENREQVSNVTVASRKTNTVVDHDFHQENMRKSGEISPFSGSARVAFCPSQNT